MWILQGIGENKQNFNLIPNKEYQVGRKDCDVLLANDASISRKHAVIKIENEGSKDSHVITLSDSSKYGTSVNGKKISSTMSLKAQDEVFFGQCTHKFRLLHRPFMIVMSCINNSEKKSTVKSLVKKLGGNFVSEFNMDCTHLVMEEVTFTVKTVAALAKGCPIVTPTFLEDSLKCCSQPSKPMVEPENYFPKLAEPSLKGKEELFKPNDERRELFRNKCFIFLSKKQFKRLSTSVKMAGGTVDLIEDKDAAKMQMILSENSLVLAPELKDENAASNEQIQWVKYVMEQLRVANLRSIKESEVGLAILNISMETYCNPMSSSDNSIAGTTSSQIIQETFADFTSQWHSTFKENPLEAVHSTASEFKKPNILANDSQYDQDKKRKRSSETSMYITDTIPVETSFQQTKRPRKNTFDDNDSDLKKLPEENLESQENPFKTNPMKVPDSTCKSIVTKAVEVRPCTDIKKEEIEESELFDDEDSFKMEEGVIVADTEVSACLDQERVHQPSEMDRSRVAESQFTADCDFVRGKSVAAIEVKSEVRDFLSSAEGNKRDQCKEANKMPGVMLSGYLNSRMLRPKIEIEPEQEDIETVDASTVVKFTSLVARNTFKKPSNVQGCSVKNFKKFKKAYYPGQHLTIPNVIGGRDLIVYQSEDENREHVFAEIRARNEDEEQREKYIDNLFNWNSDDTRQRRR